MSSPPIPHNPAHNPADDQAARSEKAAMDRRSPQKTFTQLAVVAVLSLFVFAIAVPHYLGGWPWATPLKLPDASRNALQAIPEKGLTISGWNTDEQDAIELGKEDWSVQTLSRSPTNDSPEDGSASPVFLLVRPQVYGADQPEVEWIDIKGLQRWEIDSRQQLRFALPAPSGAEEETVSVTADFFRAWSSDQTYAVLQWYAWPTGGHPSPTRWFWADQKVQWQRNQRLPWAAVSLWIPVGPLGDISPQQALAESLGKDIQRSLMQTIFIDEEDSS